MRYLKNFLLYYSTVLSIIFVFEKQHPAAFAGLVISLSASLYLRKKSDKIRIYVMIALIMAAFSTVGYVYFGMPYSSITYSAMIVFGTYLFIFIPETIRAIRLGNITKLINIEDKIERLDKLHEEKFFKNDDTYYYLSKSAFLYQLGRIEEALDVSNQVDETKLDDKKLYALLFNRAEYHIALKNFDKAMEAIETLADPSRFTNEIQKDSFVNYIFAKYYYAKGETEIGRTYLEKASDLKTITYFILAGRYAMAESDTLTAIRHLEGAANLKYVFYELDEARQILKGLRSRYDTEQLTEEIL